MQKSLPRKTLFIELSGTNPLAVFQPPSTIEGVSIKGPIGRKSNALEWMNESSFKLIIEISKKIVEKILVDEIIDCIKITEQNVLKSMTA